MKITCLSVRQPWASIIVHGPKWAENRSRPSRHKGELWVHASERWDESWDRPDDPESVYGFRCPTGVLLGRAEMLGSWPEPDVSDARGGLMPEDPALWEALLRLAEGAPRNYFGWDYVAGPHCYLLADRRPLAEPLPAKGRLGLWTFEVSADRLALADGDGLTADAAASAAARGPLRDAR